MKNYFDKEAEKCLLAMLLMGDDKINAELSALRSDYFSGTNKLLFETALRIIADGRKPDALILDEYFRKSCEPLPNDYGGIVSLFEIADNTVPSTANWEHYAMRVKKAWEKRKMQNSVSLIETELENPNCDTKGLRSKVIQEFTEIDTDTKTKIRTMGEVMISAFDDICNKCRPEYEPQSVNIGITKVDDYLDGLKKGCMTLIGARPSQGKTSLALSMFRNVIRQKIPCGFISLEMSEIQISYRLIAMNTGLSVWRLNHLLPCSENELARLNAKIAELGDSSSYIVDTPNALLSDVEANARMLVTCKGCRVLFIDYAGLISLGREYTKIPEYEKASMISKRVKNLARSLDIPIVLLVQLSREAQNRKATLADIRGSGSYEQDADEIIFIQNSEETGYYLSIAKNRNGQTGDIPINFNKEIMLFSDSETERFV